MGYACGTEDVRRSRAAGGRPVQNTPGQTASPPRRAAAIHDTLQIMYNVNLMGLMSGISNVAVNVAMSTVMEHNDREILVYGTLLILSLFEFSSAYNMYCEVTVQGGKGSNTLVYDGRKGGRNVDFYATPDGDVVPATAYRYMNSKYAKETMESMSAPGSYFGFEKFDSAGDARDAFQVNPEWSDCKVRGEFDTLQVISEMYVPGEYGDTGSGLEPFTRCYPQHGKGGCQQFIYKGKIYFKNVDIIKD